MPPARHFSTAKAQKSLEKAKKEAARLAQKVAELEKDKAKLAKKYAQAAKDSSFIGQDQKILVNQCNKDYKIKICDAVKAKVWGVFKFLSTHPEDCAKVYTLARRGMDPKIKGTEDEKKMWEFQHSTLIAYAMNKT
jgi:predicted transcriptional regulator